MRDDQETGGGAPPAPGGEDLPAIEPANSPLRTTGAAPAPETAKAADPQAPEVAPTEFLVPVTGLTRGGPPPAEVKPDPIPQPTKVRKEDRTVLVKVLWPDGMEGPNGTVLMPGTEVWMAPEAATMHAAAGKVQILKDKG